MRRNTILIRTFAVVALIAFLAVTIIAVFPTGVGAQDAQTRLENSQAQQNELQQKIDEADKQISENAAEKKRLDTEINHVQAEIDSLNTRIADSNTKIAQKESELSAAEAESRKQYESYTQRAKMMVERGSITYLEVLLNAKSFGDLLSRISIVKEIVKYDSDRLDALRETEEKISGLKTELETQKQELEDLKASEVEQMNSLTQKRSESQQLIDSLRNDKESYEKALAEQEAAEAAARAEIARLSQQSSGSSGTSTQYSDGIMMQPASGPVTSYYGSRIHPVTGQRKTHTGMDFGAAYGTNIVAAASGTVLISGYNTGGYGNYVVIDHGGGVTTLYAHASSLCVSAGEYVSQGQLIAKVGSTGMSTGPHLHFEVLVNGAHTDPLNYLN